MPDADPSTRPPGLRHPVPANIGRYVQHVGQILRDEVHHDDRRTNCACIECIAHRLAARGWPSATTGDGRGGGDLTIVEAQADSPGRFAGLDDTLHKALRTLWRAARLVEDKIADIRKHDSDNEKAAGVGDCVCCGNFCNPRKNPNDRLRKGLCPPCNTAWGRWQHDNPNGLRPDFMRARRKALGKDSEPMGESA